MKKWIAVLFLAITAAGAQSQAVTAFISNGSGGWAAAVSSSATGAISIPPPASYLYCQNQATATSFSITTDAVTVEATNSFAAGNRVYLAGWTAATYFNGQTATILSAGLSGSQYEFDFTHANVTSTNDTGTATMWVPATSACFSGGSGGTSVTVNGGSALTIANFNSTTPAAGSGYQNLPFQTSTTNVSVEAPYASSSMFGLAKVDNTTITASNGVISAVVPPPANFLASNFTTTSTSLVSTGLAFPVVPASSFKQGMCFVQAEIVVQAGMYFGLGADVAPAALYGSDRVIVGKLTIGTGSVDSVITNTTPAIIDDGGSEWAAGLLGIYTIQVSLHTGSAPTTVTLYQEVENGPGEVGALAGSGCSWLP